MKTQGQLERHSVLAYSLDVGDLVYGWGYVEKAEKHQGQMRLTIRNGDGKKSGFSVPMSQLVVVLL